MSLKIYIAASWAQHSLAEKIATLLKAANFTILSRWHEPATANEEGYKNPHGMADRAVRDLQAVTDCDALVCITGDSTTRGGRHAEFGVALALKKICIIIGYHEHVLHHLPGVAQFDPGVQAIDELINYLQAVQEIMRHDELTVEQITDAHRRSGRLTPARPVV